MKKKPMQSSLSCRASIGGEAMFSATLRSPPDMNRLSSARNRDHMPVDNAIQAPPSSAAMAHHYHQYGQHQHHSRMHSIDRSLSPRSPSPLPYATDENAMQFRFPPPSHAPPPTREQSMIGSNMASAGLQSSQLCSAIAAAASGPGQPISTSKAYQQELDEQYFATIQPDGAASHHTLNQSFRRQARNKPKLLRQAHAELNEINYRTTGRERTSIVNRYELPSYGTGVATGSGAGTVAAATGSGSGSGSGNAGTGTAAASSIGYTHHGSFAGFTTASYGSVGCASSVCTHHAARVGLAQDECAECATYQGPFSSAALLAGHMSNQPTSTGAHATGRCSFCVVGMCSCCPQATPLALSSGECCEKCGQPLASGASNLMDVSGQPTTSAAVRDTLANSSSDLLRSISCRCNSAPTLAFSQAQLDQLLLHSPQTVGQRIHRISEHTEEDEQQPSRRWHGASRPGKSAGSSDPSAQQMSVGKEAAKTVIRMPADSKEQTGHMVGVAMDQKSKDTDRMSGRDQQDEDDEDNDDECEQATGADGPFRLKRINKPEGNLPDDNKENSQNEVDPPEGPPDFCECSRLLEYQSTTDTRTAVKAKSHHVYQHASTAQPTDHDTSRMRKQTPKCAVCSAKSTPCKGMKSTLVSLAHVGSRALSPLGRLSRSSSKESIKSPKHEKKKRRFSRKGLSLLRVHHFRKSKSEESSKELLPAACSAEITAVCKARSYNYALIRELNEKSQMDLPGSSAMASKVSNAAAKMYQSRKTSQDDDEDDEPEEDDAEEEPEEDDNEDDDEDYEDQEHVPGMVGPGELGTNTALAHLGTSGSSTCTSVRPQYLFGLHVHSVDRKLKSSKCVVNPLVRLHFCNVNTGECLRSTDGELLLPVSTQPCDLLFKLRYPRLPLWEELLLINEPFHNLFRSDVILFFEILDFVSVHNSDQSGQVKPKDWWFRVAWSFLLPLHCDLAQTFSSSDHRTRKLRVQLFKPYSHTIDASMAPSTQLFSWWKGYKRIPYPSSLLISLQPVNASCVRNFAQDVNFRNLNQYLYERRLQHLYRHLHEMSSGAQPIDALDPSAHQIASSSNTSNVAPPVQGTHSPAHKHLINKPLSVGSTVNTYGQTPVVAPAVAAAAAAAAAAATTATTGAARPLAFAGTPASGPIVPPPHLQHLHHLHQTQQTSNSSAEDCDISARELITSGAFNIQKHCKLPRNVWHQLSAGNNKCCYNVAFSPDGRKIACGASVFTAYMSTEKRSSIFIYSVSNGEFLQRVNGFHSAPIYYLDWSCNNRLLASASADSTCLIWQMKRAHCAPLVLNHPCFVYTVKFHPSKYHQLATGAWDGAVRIWCIQESLRSTIKEPVLLQCVAATGSVAAATFHGQVLALCWLKSPTSGPFQSTSTSNQYTCSAAQPPPPPPYEYLLFSGCSRGHLMALKQDDNNQSWQPYLKLKLKEISNIAINELQAHPVGANRLLLFCRDGVQRMVDFHLELIVQRYIGSLNFNHLIRGCLSTDGRLLFAGSEDSIVHVWNVDTGERIYTYDNLPFRGSIASVQFHPYDNIIAVSGLNARTISVCMFRHSDADGRAPAHHPDRHVHDRSVDVQQVTETLITLEPSECEPHVIANAVYADVQSPQRNKVHIQSTSGLPPLVKNAGSLSNAENVCELHKSKPELKKSHTIDHSNPTAGSHSVSKTNQKVQKAMRKLELALRLSFNDNK